MRSRSPKSNPYLWIYLKDICAGLAVPRRLFCFGSVVILDVARCYLRLFSLYINKKIGKIVVKC